MRPAELETDRLRLRRLYTRDIPALRELLADERVRRTTLQAPRRAWRAWAEAYWQVRVDHASLALEERASGACLGFLRLCSGTVGFELRPAYWNRGFMTEALGAVVGHQPLVTWSGVVFARNRASRRVFEKCGFVLARHGLYCGHDCVFYERAPLSLPVALPVCLPHASAARTTVPA